MVSTLDNKEEKIGHRLEATRKKLMLTQSEFCEILGIGRTSYSYYVRGERDVPVSVLSTLFEKFGVDPFWFIYGDQSEESMRRKSENLKEIQEIGIAVEERATLKGIELSAVERWSVISQAYIVTIANDEEFDPNSNQAQFVIDNFIKNANRG